MTTRLARGSGALALQRAIRRAGTSIVSRLVSTVQLLKRDREGQHSLRTLGIDRKIGGDAYSWVAFYSTPGRAFEDAVAADTTNKQPAARTIAFYLPQFYPIEENDRCWGKGFTEWHNVARGMPRFEGHYQPRIPQDLGFYNLTDPDVIRTQADLAFSNGVRAFCFYYYRFQDRRLLERPLDLFMQLDTKQEFCLMWANENWTRAWDGKDKDVLLHQDHDPAYEIAFIEDTVRCFNHERYVYIEGRPLFILYRPDLVPDAKVTIARWRCAWKKRLGIEPWILMIHRQDCSNPQYFGLDGAVEFPPHRLFRDLPRLHRHVKRLDPSFRGRVWSYRDVMNCSTAQAIPDYPLIKTLVPHWDNEARRPGRGVTLVGSTPELFQTWFSALVLHAQQHPFRGEPLVFINAWNEWAEGAYLEPDVHFGHAYLNAVRRTLFASPSGNASSSIWKFPVADTSNENLHADRSA